jgi:crotonobetainyl-CoA:carnitine CoA-transferase CaiB-like acyl-CoA transferase
MWLFRQHDVPCMAVADLRDVVTNEQLCSRGLFFQIEHPKAGKIEQLATAFGFTVTMHHTPAPDLGEHNRSVLQELGYSEAEIACLKDDGVI